MIITDIVPKGKYKSIVYTDGEEWCTLMNRTVREYGLSRGEELSEAVCFAVQEELYKSALQKCGDLLGGSDYTSYSLKDKLNRSGYPEEISRRAVRAMQEAHYLNDERYAENYVRSHMGRASLQKIRYDLKQKGIDGEMAEAAIGRLSETEDLAAEEMRQIRSYLKKKNYDPEQADREQKMKLMAALFRKGYARSSIVKALDTGDFSDYY